MKRFFFGLFSLFISISFASADIGEKLEKILPSTVVKELLQQTSIKNSIYRQNNKEPLFSPNTEMGAKALSFWTGEKAPFFIETLYLYKKKDTKLILEGAEIDKISIILRSLSQLEGIEYYSTSRKKMRTLYEKSYVVDNSKSRKKISDPVQGTAEDLYLFAVQKDLTFGENLYSYSYRQNDTSVAFYSRNVESMNYGFMKLIEPDKLHFSLVVNDLGDYLLIYSLTRSSFLAIPGLETKINSSFSTRAEAIFDWFIAQYEKH